MSSEKLQLSNTSYTNKDFFDVFPELLQLAKELSYKWDPTVSNESDPGVVLIKELALAVDKINFISDKNVLETMPLSITQEQNARALYNLLGYYPKWYKSAKCYVVFAWGGDKSSTTHMILPAYTQLSDADSKYVYTTLKDVDIAMDGSITNTLVEAIEGTCENLSVNGNSLITLQMLDSNNRIYFNSTNIAYNGIFVSGGTLSSGLWTQVDNITFKDLKSTDENATHVYSFNIDQNLNKCYLEFPDNIDELIGDGLSIVYTITSGSQGTVSVGGLTKIVSSELTLDKYDIYSGIKTDVYQELVDTTNIPVQNPSTINIGEDPVGLDEMYNTWRKMAGTFDTLVTLRDYNNALRQMTDYCSNGFCCDRTNDIQNSYKVFVGSENSTHYDTFIEQDESGTDKINAFNLKLYCTQRYVSSTVSTYDLYDSTFQLYPDVDISTYSLAAGYYKIIEKLSDYKCINHDFSKLEPDKICMLKNRYSVTVRITPTYKLASEEISDLKKAISVALYSQTRCENMEFGQEIDPQELHQLILDSDSRIRYLFLDSIQYNTYAVYYTEDTLGNVTWHEIPVAGSLVGTGNRWLNNSSDKLTSAELNKQTEFRAEIYAKNVLAGVTPYVVSSTTTNNYDDNSSYDYQINSKLLVEVDAGKAIKTECTYDLVINNTDVYAEESNEKLNEITLSDNEVVQFYKPNLVDDLSYNTYINYVYNGNIIHQNSTYQLGSTEYLIVFYKEAEADTKHKLVLYGPGTILTTTFDLNPDATTADKFRQKYFQNKSLPVDGKYYTAYYAISNINDYTYLSGSQSITIQKINEQYMGGEKLNYIYFITNQTSETSDKSTYFTLTLEKDTPRILNTNEYVFITNATQTTLNIYSAGTKIEYVPLDDSTSVSWEVQQIDLSNITTYGISGVGDQWLPITSPVQLHIVEQAFVNALAEDTLTTRYDTDIIDNSHAIQVELNGSGYTYKKLHYDIMCSSAEDTPKGVTWTNGTETITGTLEPSLDNIGNIFYVPGIEDYYTVYDSRYDLDSGETSSSYSWVSASETKYKFYVAGSVFYKFQTINTEKYSAFTSVCQDWQYKQLFNRLDISDEATVYFQHKILPELTVSDSSTEDVYNLIPSDLSSDEMSSLTSLNTLLDGYWVTDTSKYFYGNAYINENNEVKCLTKSTIMCFVTSNPLYGKVYYFLGKTSDGIVAYPTFDKTSIPEEANLLTLSQIIEARQNSEVLNKHKNLSMEIDPADYDPYVEPDPNEEDDTPENISINPITVDADLLEIYNWMNNNYINELNMPLRYLVGKDTTSGYIDYSSGTDSTSLFTSDEQKYQFYISFLKIIGGIINVGYLNVRLNDDTVKSSITKSLGYDVASFLNINMSPSKAQIIKSNHIIYIKDTSGSIYTVQVSEDEGNGYIFCSQAFSSEGSNDYIPIEMVDENNNTIYPRFYAFSKVSSNTTVIDNITKQYADETNSIIKVHLDYITPGSFVSIYDDISLSGGDYIFKLYNSNDTLASLELQFVVTSPVGTDAISLSNFAEGSTYKAGIHYIAFTIPKVYSEGTLVPYILSLQVKYTKETTEAVVGDIVLYPMMKYRIFNSNSDSIHYYDQVSGLVKNRLLTYDRNKSFNYIYQIDKNSCIIDPLDSVSFNDKLHIYNKFTICESFIPEYRI